MRVARLSTALLAVSFALLALLAATGCEKPAEPEGGPVAEPPFVEAADLDRIRERGQLRVLFPRRGIPSHLPRSGYPLDFERQLANHFAGDESLTPVWVYLEERGDLIDSLLAGKGDLIAANLTVTEERRKKVDFTVPIATVREQIVARADDDSVRTVADLAGRRIAVRRSSSFWNTLQKLAKRNPAVALQVIPESIDTEDAIHRVATGEYDLTVADSNLVEAALEYRDDVHAPLDLTGDRPIAWAVRKESPALLARLNRFLTDHQLTRRDAEIGFEDLPGIRERGTLRMLTRNNAANYFLWRGRLLGFEYDLVKEFAQQQGLLLEVNVAPNQADLVDWLVQGRGDLIAASLNPLPEREARGVAFTRPYNYVSQIVVAPSDFPTIVGPVELAGRTFHVRETSAYWPTLVELRDRRGVPIEIEAAPEEMETEELIARVADGRAELTLADSHILGIELSWRDDVRGLITLKEDIPLAWGVRATNPELLKAANDFIRREYRGLFYNVTYKKYFDDLGRIRRHVQGRSDPAGRLSPYDDVVRKYAERYGFDWRLIVAQMFQESRFNPESVSFAGAEGLMQVLPRTAEELGFDEMADPETMIHAGIKYLDWTRDRFEPDLAVRDRMWFTLAAYNAGAGHVQEARRLAAARGLNPDRWFGNVEQAMLLLQKPQFAAQSRYGYCRCSEPVRYVRQIRSRYNAYLEMLGERPWGDDVPEDALPETPQQEAEAQADVARLRHTAAPPAVSAAAGGAR